MDGWMDGWEPSTACCTKERKKEIYSPYNQRYYLDGVKGSVRLGWLDFLRVVR